MEKLNRIGLDNDKSLQLAGMLNELLANYQIFYMNTRGFHWNIKGNKFFELHLKFEELYNDLLLKVDEIAERVLTLTANPTHSFSDYLKASSIKEAVDYSDANSCVKSIIESFGTLLKLQRKILAFSAEIGDEGTNSVASDYIREQEKLVWMYSSFLNNNH